MLVMIHRMVRLQLILPQLLAMKTDDIFHDLSVALLQCQPKTHSPLSAETFGSLTVKQLRGVSTSSSEQTASTDLGIDSDSDFNTKKRHFGKVCLLKNLCRKLLAKGHDCSCLLVSRTIFKNFHIICTINCAYVSFFAILEETTED